jgi:hypothetical protein
MKIKNESGIALIGTLLILVLLAALLEGFILSVNSDQELIGIDRGQTQAFYGALAGLEQLTGNLGTLFGTDYSPTVAQINALTVSPPALTGIQFVAPGGGSGYQIEFATDADGRPVAETRTVPSGPYEGLVGLITPYTMISTARTVQGSAEVQMRRSLQTIAVPVFQFGIFSETDLSFHAGATFNFGGRVHTNGNLYLAQRNGSTITLPDRITALGEVIRQRLVNGEPTSTTYFGTVNVAIAPNTYRSLARDEGSLVDGMGSAQNEPTWTNRSISTYNGNIRNGRTGARRMDLPLVSDGATPVDLVRRPAVNEDVNSPAVLEQRYYSKASLRILFSDTAANITALPTIAAGAPMQLTVAAPNGTLYATAGAWANGYRSAVGTDLIGGFIKMEMQDIDGNWSDVTNQILNLGMTGPDLTGTCGGHANAIIRVQRFKDSPAGTCDNIGTEYWPNVLYDTREGNFRDNIPTGQATVYLGGVMHYIELDVTNLANWLRASGAINENGGYVVYFSDRRTNRNTAGAETGEYGFEDVINSPNVVSGLPNDSHGTAVNGIELETAEDVNSNGLMEDYGAIPQLPPPPAAPNTAAPLDAAALPQTAVSATVARANRAIFFRRALKLVNGASFNLGNDSDGIPYGLTIASENPVYVQGNYNAPGTFAGAHVACSIVADAVTFLSSNWNDRNSFTSPHNPAGRPALTTWYRAALIAGKTRPFTRITAVEDFGTDGGVHNFIRFLENWGGQTLNYRGSIVSLFFNRQAVGTYKCCTNVYSPPSRGYNFDVEFLQPRTLPPHTPAFRDINITSFSQVKIAHE